MGRTRVLFFYLAAVLLFGALLAPWLFWVGQWGAAQTPSLKKLPEYPFRLYVSRSLQAVAFIGIWPVLRAFSANSWAAVGMVKPAGQWARLGTGFILGFTLLAVIAALALADGARVLDHDANFLSKLPAITASAIVVALMEEILFRGVIFGGLRRSHPLPQALWFSSALYAVVHFFQKAESPATVTWSSGFVVLGQMLRGFVDVHTLVPGFFTLTVAGLLLGLAFHRTGNLYLSLGLHAGWVFWLKSYNAITDQGNGASRWLWGVGKLYDGWLTFALLAAALAFAWWWPIPRRAKVHAH